MANQSGAGSFVWTDSKVALLLTVTPVQNEEFNNMWV